MLRPFNVSLKGEKLFVRDYLTLESFHPHRRETTKLTLKLWIKRDMSSHTFSACSVLFFFFVYSTFPPLCASLPLPRLSWRERVEIHVLGRVFVSNGSAGAAVVAGISITPVVPFLPCIDQRPVSG